MKILIVSPPVRDMYFTPGRSSALGMHTIASLLRKRGETVQCINCPSLKPEGTAIQPIDKTDYLQKYIIPGERGKISFFTGYKHFGPSFQECTEQIKLLKPDFIFISCFAFAYAENTVAFIDTLRKQQCAIPVGIGGSGASAFPEYFLDKTNAVFVFSGEGEKVLPLLMHRIKKGTFDFSDVPNTYFVKKGKIIAPSHFIYPESEDLEFIWSITGESSDTFYISTSLSRGCPRRCQFCSNFITHKRQFRTVPFEKVEKKITDFPKNKRIVLNFEDDNLSFVPDYFSRILELFTSTFPNIQFMAENGIDYSFLTPESIRKLAAYGFRQFNLSLGTLSEETAIQEKRPLSLTRYETIIHEIEKYRIPVITYFICGLQNDTPGSIVKTLLYLASVPTRIGISPFYPVPGLPGFTNKEYFLNHPPSLCRGAAFYPWNKTLSTEEMVSAFRLARYVNLLKQKEHTPLEKELLSRIKKEKELYTIVRRHKRNILMKIPFMNNAMTALFFKNVINISKSF